MILIDYNPIVISAVCVLAKQTGQAVDDDLVRHMVLNSIRAFRKNHKQKYGEIVLCADGPRSWRKEVFPHYKAHRKGAKAASDIDWDALHKTMAKIFTEISENFPYKCLQVENCEADDIIAQIALNTQEFGNWENVLIVSNDKDFIQLQVLDNVSQYAPAKRKMLAEPNPRLQLQRMILQGDAVDGIPNVLSVDDAFTNPKNRQAPLRESYIGPLIDNPEVRGEEIYRNYCRNKKLIDLTEIPDPLKQNIINTYENYQDVSGNSKKVMNYLIKNRCSQLLESLGDFVK